MRNAFPLVATVVSLMAAASLSCQAQNTQTVVPHFEDFAVNSSFQGKPARPVLGASQAFRTEIFEGAAKGPNFAGHYTIIEWGCGSGCIAFAIVDAVSGRIYYPIPFDALALPYQGTATGREYKGLEYRLNSALLVADGCPENENTSVSETLKNCATRYYKWDQKRFVLVASVAVPPRK